MKPVYFSGKRVDRICNQIQLDLVFLGYLPTVNSWAIYLSLGSLICKMGIMTVVFLGIIVC